jgi:hypothetical protein
MDSLGYVSQVIQLTDSTVYIIGKHTLQWNISLKYND